MEPVLKRAAVILAIGALLFIAFDWFLSWPLIGSSLLYMGFILIMTLSTEKTLMHAPYWRLVQVLLAAVLFGISQGMVRERSQSLFPAMFFHIITAVATIILIRML